MQKRTNNICNYSALYIRASIDSIGKTMDLDMLCNACTEFNRIGSSSEPMNE